MGIESAFRDARTGALLLTVWVAWSLAFVTGEVIPVNEGLGWDGVRFARMVEGGPSLLADREINSYYVQRVGPSFAVRLILQAQGVDLEASSIRLGFVMWNLTLLSLALVLLLDAAQRLALSPASRWVLLLGLFLNPANGRLPIYYAPIGDSTAFLLGSLIFWAYVARRQMVMAMAFLLAIVSWPAAFLLLPLLVWPRPDEATTRVEAAPLPLFATRLVMAVSLPLGLGLLALLTRTVDMPDVAVWSRGTILAVGTNAFQLGCVAGLLLAMTLCNRARVFSRPSLLGLITACALVGISVLYVRRFESGSLAFGSGTFVREILLFTRSGAFGALVGHAAYYSSLAVAAMALWPRVLGAGLSLGPGAFFSLGLSGLVALDAESRRLNAFWPLVGFLTVLVLDSAWSSRARVIAFVAIALAMSKLWWPMVGPALFSAKHEPGNYFNTQGPSMSGDAYLVHALATLAFGLFVRFGCAPGPGPEPEPS